MTASRRLFRRLPVFMRGRRLLVVVLLAIFVATCMLSSSFRSSRTYSAPKPPSKSSLAPAVTNSYIPSLAWQTPFSFSVSSADSDVVVLPQLEDRCPVYTFYDRDMAAAAGRNTTVEERLTAVWRQAFWALGFRPTVLDLSHAQRSPLYKSVDGLNLDGESKIDAMRYLAWSSSPTGVLTTNRVVPMTTWPTENTWTFWRSCQFGPLTTYKDIGSGFIIGSQPALNDYVTKTFASATRAKIVSAASNLFHVEPKTDFLAQYSPDFVAKNYKNLPEDKLPDLINAHLHSNFLSRFSDGGISILDPFPESAHAIALPSLATATALATCPPVEFEAYCPSNIPNCYKCSVSMRKDFIKTVQVIPDSPSTFAMITIPHPMMSLALSYSTSGIAADFVRRKSSRDMFVRKVTSEIIKQGAGAPARALQLKRMAAASSELLDARYVSVFESQFALKDCLVSEYFRWAVGFNFGPSVEHIWAEESNKQESIWRRSTSDAISFDALAHEIGMCLPAHEYIELQKEAERIVDPIAGGSSRPMSVSTTITAVHDRLLNTDLDRKLERSMIEAWNMADAEVWRFVKALNERAAQEEKVWELV
ncbi:hypothetical protein POJ06DRAFT_45417 [Lipomyces tetrasporus]|uniref:Uncharacterized protein n=1 Tax=Lipomyces tetrasporus TaxID=54092 RepID=A0AAD7VNV7_9ASCO|nr:uncharacterized protein POJ06DRAFT_45417 [Lipomyces tetrasporus]KAJ8096862.1 hypothetical protein POJ06DRAFT_45417 [Lipomyces tetrasporus]